MKRKQLYFLTFITLFFLLPTIFGYGREREVSPYFNEELLSSEDFNPEMNVAGIPYGYLSVNEDGKVSLTNNGYKRRSGQYIDESVFEDIYTDEKRMTYFYYNSGFENWYVKEVSNAGEETYRVRLSEIEGLDESEMEREFQITDTFYQKPGKGLIYPLANGNFVIMSNYSGYIKKYEIDPYTKKLINKVVFLNSIDDGIKHNVSIVTEKYTVICNPGGGKFLYYESESGELEKEIQIPGFSGGSDIFKTSEICVCDGYWYIANEEGVYRAKADEMDWESVLSFSDSKNVSVELFMSFEDILVTSNNDIYIYLFSNYRAEGSKATSILVKFEIL